MVLAVALPRLSEVIFHLISLSAEGMQAMHEFDGGFVGNFQHAPITSLLH
jgi:hypothetical protein